MNPGPNPLQPNDRQTQWSQVGGLVMSRSEERPPPTVTVMQAASHVSGGPHNPGMPDENGGRPGKAIEAHLEQLRQAELVAEAEDAAHGKRHLSVVTGNLETSDDVARVEQLTATAWAGREGAHMTASPGGSDYLTLVIEGPCAAQFVDELAALAEELNPGFWRVSRSSSPF